MKKLFGFLLLVNALAVIAGLFLEKNDFWYVVDYCTVAFTAIGGYLLIKDQQRVFCYSSLQLLKCSI